MKGKILAFLLVPIVMYLSYQIGIYKGKSDATIYIMTSEAKLKQGTIVRIEEGKYKEAIDLNLSMLVVNVHAIEDIIQNDSILKIPSRMLTYRSIRKPNQEMINNAIGNMPRWKSIIANYKKKEV